MPIPLKGVLPASALWFQAANYLEHGNTFANFNRPTLAPCVLCVPATPAPISACAVAVAPGAKK